MSDPPKSVRIFVQRTERGWMGEGWGVSNPTIARSDGEKSMTGVEPNIARAVKLEASSPASSLIFLTSGKKGQTVMRAETTWMGEGWGNVEPHHRSFSWGEKHDPYGPALPRVPEWAVLCLAYAIMPNCAPVNGLWTRAACLCHACIPQCAVLDGT